MGTARAVICWFVFSASDDGRDDVNQDDIKEAEDRLSNLLFITPRLSLSMTVKERTLIAQKLFPIQ